MEKENFKIKPLKGLKALKAFNVYYKLVIALSTSFYNKEKSFQGFLEKFESYDESERKHLLRHACVFVFLDEDEVEALTRFAVDEQQIAYESAAVKTLEPARIIDIMSEVAFEISKCKVFFYLKKN